MDYDRILRIADAAAMLRAVPGYGSLIKEAQRYAAGVQEIADLSGLPYHQVERDFRVWIVQQPISLEHGIDWCKNRLLMGNGLPWEVLHD